MAVKASWRILALVALLMAAAALIGPLAAPSRVGAT